ncbi:MAG: 2-phospho-L-lactate transferase [Acidimicrobiaceae bacterium]|nr:2-phospho-L-lactate transferase [Acidimicrobiaceae bacterium]MCY4281205.1 2-phospho-L-lactate transferase [Acidimicrobiaceae bacterium]MCY4294716.1 2-phospho-L-lactate transferase [Acidimicrobiaceae bacterium]
MITVISGGVGAARYLTGQLLTTPAREVTAVVNVADDVELHGLRISPDIDTVIYTLSGAVDRGRGWGLADETWHALTGLQELGLDAWFRLGDRDLATHMFRTTLLREGRSLSEVTARLAAARGLECRVLPVSDDPIETRVTLAATRSEPQREVGFQEYFVRLGHKPAVAGVRFAGIDAAEAAPGVLEAINDADAVVIAPSNPVVSIGPVLAVRGVAEALAARRERNVAVSPLVAGATLKGPADRMMRSLGEAPSAVGVARRYRDLVAKLVIDEADAGLAEAVAATGVEPVVAQTVMSSPQAAAALALTAVAAL